MSLFSKLLKILCQDITEFLPFFHFILQHKHLKIVTTFPFLGELHSFEKDQLHSSHESDVYELVYISSEGKKVNCFVYCHCHFVVCTNKLVKKKLTKFFCLKESTCNDKSTSVTDDELDFSDSENSTNTSFGASDTSSSSNGKKCCHN